MKSLFFVILSLVISLACFQAAAKGKMKKDSLEDAFKAAIEQSHQDSTSSRMKLELEEKNRYASWHGTEKSIIIAASHQVDPADQPEMPAAKPAMESQVDAEETLKNDLQDL